MKLSTVVKPRKITAVSKSSIRSKFRGSGGTRFCNYGSNIMVQGNGDRETVVAFNFEKRRPKKRQLKTTFDGLHGKVNKTKIEQRGEWIGHVYHFPVVLLKAMNIRIVQNSRNFEIQKVK